MRTTIRLDEELLTQAKVLAAQSSTTLTAIIEDALREKLARQRSLIGREQVKVTTVTGRGPQPGIDLDDSAALLAAMEATNGLA